jgi:DNA invertase Pin-like site-specific DNA recombinase
LQECRRRKATLLIAKLDRLGRNVAFISALMESGADFVCCDNPHANRLMLHMLAAFAEHEREQISQRTRAALAAAKARGVKLGSPRPLESPEACERRPPFPQACAGSAEHHAQPGRAGDELPRHCPRIEPAQYQDRQGLPVV